MKNIFTYLLVALLLVSPFNILLPDAAAQSWQWGRTGTGVTCDAFAVATDPSGNVFGAGWTTGGSSAMTLGTVILPGAPGSYRTMWAKYDNSGTPLWADGTISGNTNLNNIATDPSGNLIVFGAFTSATMQIGSFTLTNLYTGGLAQYFLAKISPTGTVLWAIADGNTYPSYSTALGMFILTMGGVGTDAAGNIYITSAYRQATMSIGSTTLTNTSTTGTTYDIYVAKYDPSGTPLWATSVGGAGNDYGYGLTVASTGNVYITGTFNSLSMPVGSSTISNPYAVVIAGTDTPIAYIAKFDGATGAPLWAEAAGGDRGAFGVGLAHDNSGNVYLTGGFGNSSITWGSTTITRPHPAFTTNRLSLYLVQYSASDAVTWDKCISSDTGNVFGYSIALASCGQVWVNGNYTRRAFVDTVVLDTVMAWSATTGTSIPGDPMFIAGYSLSGGVVGVAGIASGGDDQGGIACDAAGNVFMCADIIPAIKVGSDNLPASTGGSENFLLAKYANVVAPPDTTNLRTDTTMCDIGGITLHAPPGYSSYYWDDGSGDTVRNITSTGTYWVYATTCGVEVVLDSFVVTFAPADSVYTHTDTSVCANIPTITLSSPPGYPSHSWSTGATTPSIAVTVSGQYILTAYGGCDLLVDTFNLTITPVDTTLITTDTNICNSTTSLMLIAPPGYSTYSWTTGSTSSFITVTSSGTYSVLGTGVCSILLDTFDVTFLPVPVVSLGNDTAFCVGNTLTLSSSQPAGSSYLWSTGSTASSISVSTSAIYSLTVTYSNGCATTDAIDVTVSPYPIVDLGPDTAICDGTNPTLQSSVAYPTGSTYLWSTGSTSSSIVVAFIGSYWLQVTVAGCAAADTMVVENIHDTLHFEMVDTAICIGETIKVRAVGTPGMTYQWMPTAGIAAHTTANPLITPDTSATYYLTASISTCPDIVAAFHVDVQPYPKVDIGEKHSVCSNDSLHIRARINPAWYKHYIYTWTPALNLDDPTASNVVFTPGDSTNMTLTVTTSAGCNGKDSALLVVYPGDFASLDTQIRLCPHDTAIFLPVSTDPNTTYRWYPALFLSDSTTANPIVRPVVSQGYWAVATSSRGCKDTISAIVNVNAGGMIELGDSATIFPGESYQIPTKTNCVSFAWFPPAGLDNSRASDPVASPQISTKYIVRALTQWGCEVTDSINIYVSTESLLGLPNAFAPGSIGPNSKFRLLKRGEATLNYFRIYNRWGNMVFETKDIDEGWDGTYKGVPQPYAVYVYQIEAVTGAGTVFFKKGNVTLIR